MVGEITILSCSSPKVHIGEAPTPWSDGEPDMLEWEIYAVSGISTTPGNTVKWWASLPSPAWPTQKVVVFCEFTVNYVGSEGTLYGHGTATHTNPTLPVMRACWRDLDA